MILYKMYSVIGQFLPPQHDNIGEFDIENISNMKTWTLRKGLQDIICKPKLVLIISEMLDTLVTYTAQ